MKRLSIVILVVLIALMPLAGCAGDGGKTGTQGSETQGSEAQSTEAQNTEAPTGGDAKAPRVILLVPGNLGDKSFFDAANQGVELIKSELHAETKVVEMGTDATKWEPNFLDAIDAKYDIIISGNATTEIMNTLAAQYPDQKFINFDTMESAPPANVYSMFYSTNQVSFMAGACAALVTGSDMPLANPEPLIGFLGGMDIPGINDFLVGYIQGAQYVNPDIKVFVSYAGDFGDPAKGKELTLVQYSSGADVIFNVAGGTGLGLMDAAKESDRYAIGVDSDQALLFEDTDPEKAAHIVTSAVKYIDQALLRAVKRHVEGTLPYGTHEEMGIKEAGVGLAENSYYTKLLPESAREQLKGIEQDIIDGKITVQSAFGMETKAIDDLRESVKP